MQPNEILINPIETWQNGGVKYLPLIRFNFYSNYDFKGSPGFVNYSLCELCHDASGIPYYQNVHNSVIDLPWSLIENWGNDDTPIFDYVLQQLNLTRA